MKSDCADLQASLAVDAAMHYQREEPALGGAAVVLIRGIYHLISNIPVSTRKSKMILVFPITLLHT